MCVLWGGLFVSEGCVMHPCVSGVSAHASHMSMSCVQLCIYIFVHLDLLIYVLHPYMYMCMEILNVRYMTLRPSRIDMQFERY